MLNHKRILIEVAPGLGDLIMITPVLEKIKELYPDCILSILTVGQSVSIIERLKCIDHAYKLDSTKLFKQIRPVTYLRKQDYVIFTTNKLGLAIWAWLLRVPLRAGVCKDKYRKFPFFNCFFPYDYYNSYSYKIASQIPQSEILSERIFRALQINATVKNSFSVSLPTKEEEHSLLQKLSLEQFNLQSPYAVICPYGNTSNNLTEELIGKSVQYLINRYNLTCIITDAQERDFSNLMENTPRGKLVNLCGKITIMEMVSLFQHASLTVSTDSGPMHISCACKIPTVGVFSSDTPKRWAPSEYCHPVSIYADCSPCLERKSNCPYNKKCINDIPFDMIATQIDLILNQKSDSISLFAQKMS